jgi:AmmeMemoRadiSam system protein A
VKTRGPVLATWARAHLRATLGGPSAQRPSEPWCEEPAATFVTLRWSESGELQGCIGALRAHRAIADDVASNVVSAALHDPRTDPIVLGDIDALDLEISLLTPLERIFFADEREMLAAIRPGVDGLVLEYRDERATLLPVMWTHLPELDSFLGALKQKAGLSRKFFSPELRLYRYTTDRYSDPAPRTS